MFFKLISTQYTERKIIYSTTLAARKANSQQKEVTGEKGILQMVLGSGRRMIFTAAFDYTTVENLAPKSSFTHPDTERLEDLPPNSHMLN